MARNLDSRLRGNDRKGLFVSFVIHRNMKITNAIYYAKLLKPKVCFPVHDGMLRFGVPKPCAPAEVSGGVSGVSVGVSE